MPRPPQTEAEILTKAREVIEFRNRHDRLPQPSGDEYENKLYVWLHNLRRRFDAFNDRYPGLEDKLNRLSPHLLVCKFSRELHVGPWSANTSGALWPSGEVKYHTCIVPSCPRGAVYQVDGAYCSECALERQVADGELEYDENDDRYFGFDVDGNWMVAEGNPSGIYSMPFSAVIHPDVPEEWKQEREEFWNKRRADRSLRYSKDAELKKKMKATLPPATPEFLREVHDAAGEFEDGMDDASMMNASKGAKRSSSSHLYNSSLKDHECIGWLIKAMRGPPFLLITYEEHEDGDYMYDDDSGQYIQVKDGEGTHVRLGRHIHPSDFDEGGVLEGRLRTVFVAEGNEQQALDGEKCVHEKWRHKQQKLFANVGGGARIGRKTSEHAVALVEFACLDLLFGDDPVLAVHSQVGSGKKALVANAVKNYNGQDLSRVHYVKPNNDRYLRKLEYQRQRAIERAKESDDARSLEGEESDDNELDQKLPARPPLVESSLNPTHSPAPTTKAATSGAGATSMERTNDTPAPTTKAATSGAGATSMERTNDTPAPTTKAATSGAGATSMERTNDTPAPTTKAATSGAGATSMERTNDTPAPTTKAATSGAGAKGITPSPPNQRANVSSKSTAEHKKSAGNISKKKQNDGCLDSFFVVKRGSDTNSANTSKKRKVSKWPTKKTAGQKIWPGLVADRMKFKDAIVLYGKHNWNEVSNHVGKSQSVCEKFWNERVDGRAKGDWLKQHTEYDEYTKSEGGGEA